MRHRIPVVLAAATAVVALPSTASAARVAEWQMDEGPGATTMTDSAISVGGANDGTIGSVETGVSPLVSGAAYQFDGATSYVTVPDDPALDPGAANITLQATVEVEDGPMLDDSYEIIRKGVTTTPGGHWKMEIKRSGTDPTVGKLLCVFKGVVSSSGPRVAVQRIANVDIVDSQQHTLTCIKTSTAVQAVVGGRTFTTTKSAGSIANDQQVVIGSKVAGDDVLQGVLDQVTVDIG